MNSNNSVLLFDQIENDVDKSFINEVIRKLIEDSKGRIQLIDMDKNDVIDATKSINMNQGDDVYFYVSLVKSEDGAPLSGREITVTFTNVFDQVTDFLVITDSNGKANISLKNLKPGRYTVVSKFNGDSVYDAASITTFANVRSENYLNILFDPDYIQIK